MEPPQYSRFIAQDIAKEVACHDDVKLGGTGCQLHGAVINVHMVQCYIGIGLVLFCDCAAPEPACGKDVALIDAGDLFAAALGGLKAKQLIRSTSGTL